eukprot:PLAT6840.2.p1 GENE.PLAT6840.2~~PLAT6840.2.p1  ORF type:complete len:828 (-),score=255.03 PLAT6840.2:84-2501(-)
MRVDGGSDGDGVPDCCPYCSQAFGKPESRIAQVYCASRAYAISLLATMCSSCGLLKHALAGTWQLPVQEPTGTRRLCFISQELLWRSITATAEGHRVSLGSFHRQQSLLYRRAWLRSGSKDALLPFLHHGAFSTGVRLFEAALAGVHGGQLHCPVCKHAPAVLIADCSLSMPMVATVKADGVAARCTASMAALDSDAWPPVASWEPVELYSRRMHNLTDLLAALARSVGRDADSVARLRQLQTAAAVAQRQAHSVVSGMAATATQLRVSAVRPGSDFSVPRDCYIAVEERPFFAWWRQQMKVVQLSAKRTPLLSYDQLLAALPVWQCSLLRLMDTFNLLGRSSIAAQRLSAEEEGEREEDAEPHPLRGMRYCKKQSELLCWQQWAALYAFCAVLLHSALDGCVDRPTVEDCQSWLEQERERMPRALCNALSLLLSTLRGGDRSRLQLAAFGARLQEDAPAAADGRDRSRERQRPPAAASFTACAAAAAFLLSISRRVLASFAWRELYCRYRRPVAWLAAVLDGHEHAEVDHAVELAFGVVNSALMDEAAAQLAAMQCAVVDSLQRRSLLRLNAQRLDTLRRCRLGLLWEAQLRSIGAVEEGDSVHALVDAGSLSTAALLPDEQRQFSHHIRQSLLAVVTCIDDALAAAKVAAEVADDPLQLASFDLHSGSLLASCQAALLPIAVEGEEAKSAGEEALAPAGNFALSTCAHGVIYSMKMLPAYGSASSSAHSVLQTVCGAGRLPRQIVHAAGQRLGLYIAARYPQMARATRISAEGSTVVDAPGCDDGCNPDGGQVGQRSCIPRSI